MVNSLGSLKGSPNSTETALMFLINYRVRAAFLLQLLKKVLCLVLAAPIASVRELPRCVGDFKGCMIPTCSRVKSQAGEGRTCLGVDISVLDVEMR